MTAIPDNDNNLDGPMIFIIIGKAYEKDGDEEGVRYPRDAARTR